MGRRRSGRRRRFLVSLVVAVSLVGVVLARPYALRASGFTGEKQRHGVSTLVGVHPLGEGAWGLNAKRGRLALSQDDCLVLVDLTQPGAGDGEHLVSWPRGARVVGPEGDVALLLPDGQRVRVGDGLSWAAATVFDAAGHGGLPASCRELPGIQLFDDWGLSVEE